MPAEPPVAPRVGLLSPPSAAAAAPPSPHPGGNKGALSGGWVGASSPLREKIDFVIRANSSFLTGGRSYGSLPRSALLNIVVAAALAGKQALAEGCAVPAARAAAPAPGDTMGARGGIATLLLLLLLLLACQPRPLRAGPPAGGKSRPANPPQGWNGEKPGGKTFGFVGAGWARRDGDLRWSNAGTHGCMLSPPRGVGRPSPTRWERGEAAA